MLPIGADPADLGRKMDNHVRRESVIHPADACHGRQVIVAPAGNTQIPTTSLPKLFTNGLAEETGAPGYRHVHVR